MVVIHIFIVLTTGTARQLLRGVGTLLPNPRVADSEMPSVSAGPCGPRLAQLAQCGSRATSVAMKS